MSAPRLDPSLRDGGQDDILHLLDIDEEEPVDELTFINEYYHISADLKVEAQDDAWDALPGFINRLSGLRYLTWACRTRLPPSVMQILPRTCELANLFHQFQHLHYTHWRDEPAKSTRTTSA
jgi:hypothetical protein